MIEKIMTFNDFILSVDNITKDMKCTKIEYQGFNELEGSRYILTIRQTLINQRFFIKNGRPSRLIKVSINSSYLDDNTIPYLEIIFINAYLRKIILDMQ